MNVDFKEIFQRVSQVLQASSVPYMLTGSFASSYYGFLRATHDVDMVISPTIQSLRQLVENLNAKGYYADLQAALLAHREHSMFNAIDNETGWKIDFMFCKPTTYAREAFQRRKEVTFQQNLMFVSTAEDLLVSKLEWAKMGESARQIEDVAAVLKKQRNAVDFAYIEKWVKELEISSQWDTARKLAGLE
jgi:hypothetical protein